MRLWDRLKNCLIIEQGALVNFLERHIRQEILLSEGIDDASSEDIAQTRHEDYLWEIDNFSHLKGRTTPIELKSLKGTFESSQTCQVHIEHKPK